MSTTAPELLSHEEAAKYLHVTRGTLYVWRATNRYAIPYIQLGKGPVFYKPADLDDFLAANRHVPQQKEERERQPRQRSGRTTRGTRRGSR